MRKNINPSRLEPTALMSAQVILKPAAGARSDPPPMAIASSNLQQALPDPETANRVLGAFRTLGFEAGPCVGISFSITAPRERFERVFGVRMNPKSGGGLVVMHGNHASLTFPLQRLAPELAPLVHAVAITAPPDFGPGGFG